MQDSRAYVRRRLAVAAMLLCVTATATWAVSSRLHLDPNVAALLPERGESAALRLYLSAFGGSDLALVLVAAPRNGETDQDDDAADTVKRTASRIATQLQALNSVKRATAQIQMDGKLDPVLIWRHANAAARERLAHALTPKGMRKRLRESRALLLAPGAGAASEIIAKDPLRLTQLVHHSDGVGSGFRTQADGSFASDDGLARLVLVFPAGQALRGDDARAFVTETRQVLERHRAEQPHLYIGLTGGHAIAEATEVMLTRDLTLSGSVSMLLASLAFALTFRRLRALLAVMPPLFVGSLWTAGIAAGLPGGLSAIAVAFMSVVIGVGVDTGVHVYAALLEARRSGLSPTDAARVARQRTARPVLVAAVTAGAAFASLALSQIAAMRQLGILCAGGEILTALAIVAITPEIGARLERSAPPPFRPPRWTYALHLLTKSKPRALACLAVSTLPFLALAAGYTPKLAEAIVAIRPGGLEPLVVQQRIYKEFGGRRGQWVVLIGDDDLENARMRADAIMQKLATISEHVESVDALTTIAPAKSTQRMRLQQRDALNLPQKADELERALVDEQFAVDRFSSVLDAMRHPSNTLIELSAMQNDSRAIMLSRYIGRQDDKNWIVIYLLPRLQAIPLQPEAAAEAERQNLAHAKAVESAIHSQDPDARLTGYGRLDRSLRQSLAEDMPRIGIVASILVLLALVVSLRRPRDVVLAAAVVSTEIAAVLVLIRVFDVPLHAYDALVLPVLLGITVDEAMFLLFRAREAPTGAQSDTQHDAALHTLQHEGPPVATTALTTAAGFSGLLLCDFDGLRHLGMVGAIGSISGLLVALVIVPAGLRLLPAHAGPAR